MDMPEYIIETLRELAERRNRLTNAYHQELHKLDQTETNLRSMFTPGGTNLGPPALPPTKGKYASISVRWAVLHLLAEDALESMTTGEIAETLLAGGATTAGKSFASNVSAVLSDMVHQRHELEVDNGKYRIASIGRMAWNAIKSSPRYRQQLSLPDATLQ